MALFDLTPKESPRELYGREAELEEFVRLLKARRWVIVLGPRMVGKTSLIKAANPALQKIGFKTIYVNLWGVRGTRGFLTSLLRGMSAKGTLEKIKEFLGRIEGISIGPGGISISVCKKPFSTVWNVLDMLGRSGQDFIIELDEVQELSAISGQLHRMLGNIFSTYRNLLFVFTGSMFGLIRTLLEPEASSPLFGRPPARLHLKPFAEDAALNFLRAGFKECELKVEERCLKEAVERLDGIPGWLTLYGNLVAIQRLEHEKALEQAICEGQKIVRDELEHFLERRDKDAYLTVLKAITSPASWSEIRRALEQRKGSVNDATVHNILENLKASMLIQEENGLYRIVDPMLRSFLLSSTF
jgi:AAA+ ATPase superfamily predicted ATPase